MRTFDYIQDPAHGWIKIPVSLLVQLKIADKISPYSYYRAGFAYLEEDNDYSIFYRAFYDWTRLEPVLRSRISRNRQSKIRGYDRFKKSLHIIEAGLLSNPAAAALHNAGKLLIISI